MLSTILAVFLASGASVVAQLPSVVCVAGQCLEGFSNTTLGTTLSASGESTSVLLLPDQYTSSTSPQLLHDLLTSSSASLSPSTGFSNSSSHSSVSLPLTVALQPGIVFYPQTYYSGQGSYTGLSASSTVNATTLDASSLALSDSVWVEVSAGGNSRVILWNSIPDVTQLPQTASGSLSLINLQSTACSPPCSGNGVCSASGTCMCPAGFNGTSCETCAKGYYGSTCQACPSGCADCDDGMAGSGRCLSSSVSNPPSSCNCINGQCGENNQCTCLAGWTSASNGTQCATCASGFFLASNGNCEVCSLGCTECSDGTGDCITCQSGFTQDTNDRTLCDAVQQKTSGGVTCPSGSYSAGSSCPPCAPECQTCTGSTSNDCVVCASGTYSFNGSCVQTNSDGVCQGSSSLIGNNNKHECDSCGPKCTSCQIPNFNVGSTINEVQCTGCLPGYVIYQGACVPSCPTGTFLSPTDNLTCTACSSSCSSCAGSANYCLTCNNGQLASGGSCVSSCPSNTFSSSGTCVTCHPDCATCSGGSFNQCTSCNKNLPVLTNGRCLATCSQDQYFDTTSSSCQSCDGSCASCSSSGPNNCLACSSSSQVLRGGTCVAANCSSGSSVISGLGACLNELVLVPSSSGSPLPAIPGISTPTRPKTSLSWWEILLMTLGCAFIFVACLWLWRRRARKQRAKETAAFASAKALDHKSNWRLRLARFGGKLFGHAPRDSRPESEEIAMWKLRAAEEARHNRHLEKLIENYAHSGADSPHGFERDDYASHRSHRLSGNSIYSEVTGIPQRGPEPRQPVKTNPLTSRFSSTTLGSSVYKKPSLKRREPFPPELRTEAEAFAASVREGSGGSYTLTPMSTGGSRNPFRK